MESLLKVTAIPLSVGSKSFICVSLEHLCPDSLRVMLLLLPTLYINLGTIDKLALGEVVVLYLYRPQMHSQPQVASSTSLGFFTRF